MMISLPCSSLRPYSPSTPPLSSGRGRSRSRRSGGLPAARRLALLGDQLVGREIGEIVEGLDAGLAEGDEHLLGQMGNLGEGIVDAESLPLAAVGFLALGQRFLGAFLQLFGEFVVEAFDRRQFRAVHVSDFLELGEAFSDEQLHAIFSWTQGWALASLDQ